MSNRGSFVTEYIYCEECLKAAKKVLLGNVKELCSRQLPSWEKGKKLPIISGKIGGLYENEEVHTFKDEFIPKMQKLMCKGHSIKIGIFPDGCDPVLMVAIGGGKK